MPYIEKILERIYSEKDFSTNVAVFFGAMAFLYVYTNFENDPYLGGVAFLALFSLTKTFLRLIVSVYNSKKKSTLSKKEYSELEKSVILAFTRKGTAFVALSDLNKGKYEIDSTGLDSLVSRGVIEFVDRSFGDGPTGFQLSRDVYVDFLE